MRIKTIFVILFTAFLTVFLMRNTDEVKFDFIFVKMEISKLLVVSVFTLIGFILGYWAGKPKAVIRSSDHTMDENEASADHKDTLSEEDRDYIS